MPLDFSMKPKLQQRQAIFIGTENFCNPTQSNLHITVGAFYSTLSNSTTLWIGYLVISNWLRRRIPLFSLAQNTGWWDFTTYRYLAKGGPVAHISGRCASMAENSCRTNSSPNPAGQLLSQCAVSPCWLTKDSLTLVLAVYRIYKLFFF